MFDISFLELLLVGLVALLVLGPERLPGAARRAGLWIGRIRRFTAQMSQEIERQLKAEELREKLRREGDQLGLEKIRQTVEDALGEARRFEHLVTRDPAEMTAQGGGSTASSQAERNIAPGSSERPLDHAPETGLQTGAAATPPARQANGTPSTFDRPASSTVPPSPASTRTTSGPDGPDGSGVCRSGPTLHAASDSSSPDESSPASAR